MPLVTPQGRRLAHASSLPTEPPGRPGISQLLEAQRQRPTPYTPATRGAPSTPLVAISDGGGHPVGGPGGGGGGDLAFMRDYVSRLLTELTVSQEHHRKYHGIECGGHGVGGAGGEGSKFEEAGAAGLHAVAAVSSADFLPSWLMDRRLLQPLFVAYDARIAQAEADRDSVIMRASDIEARCEAVAAENDRLYEELEAAYAIEGKRGTGTAALSTAGNWSTTTGGKENIGGTRGIGGGSSQLNNGSNNNGNNSNSDGGGDMSRLPMLLRENEILTASVRDANETITQLRRSLAISEKRVESLAGTTTSLDAQLLAAQKLIAAERRARAAAETEVDALTGDAEAQDAVVSGVREASTALESANRSLTAEVLELRAALESLRDRLGREVEAHDTEQRGLTDALRVAEQAAENAEIQLADAEAAVASTERALEIARGRADDITEALTLAETRCADLEDRLRQSNEEATARFDTEHRERQREREAAAAAAAAAAADSAAQMRLIDELRAATAAADARTNAAREEGHVREAEWEKRSGELDLAIADLQARLERAQRERRAAVARAERVVATAAQERNDARSMLPGGGFCSCGAAAAAHRRRNIAARGNDGDGDGDADGYGGGNGDGDGGDNNGGGGMEMPVCQCAAGAANGASSGAATDLATSLSTTRLSLAQAQRSLRASHAANATAARRHTHEVESLRSLVETLRRDLDASRGEAARERGKRIRADEALAAWRDAVHLQQACGVAPAMSAAPGHIEATGLVAGQDIRLAGGSNAGSSSMMATAAANAVAAGATGHDEPVTPLAEECRQLALDAMALRRRLTGDTGDAGDDDTVANAKATAATAHNGATAPIVTTPTDIAHLSRLAAQVAVFAANVGRASFAAAGPGPSALETRLATRVRSLASERAAAVSALRDAHTRMDASVKAAREAAREREAARRREDETRRRYVVKGKKKKEKNLPLLNIISCRRVKFSFVCLLLHYAHINHAWLFF
jgi:hypothetical protein